MKTKEPYNWWTDPKNKEEVDRISWWNHPENQVTTSFPIAVIETDGMWVVAPSSETENLIGNLGQAAQGKTKEEAIKKMFMLIRMAHEYSEDCRRNYERFVPFRKGNWKHTGGKWFVLFGFNFYFRYGKNMKGGWFIPFTKINISIRSYWKAYKVWKQEKAKSKNGNNQ